MSASTRFDLIAAWLAMQRNWWSHEAMEHLCREQPEECWPTLLSLLDAADTEELLGDIAAGPLEDFLKHHGPQFVGRVEQEAMTNAKLRIALASVWLPRSGDATTGRLVQLGCQMVAPQE
jgi:hypothetical protein